MSTIFEKLREDHEVQRELMDNIVSTSGDESARREQMKLLKEELTEHAAAEERHFYSKLMAHDNSQDKARHSVAEHKDIDDLVEELETIDMSSSQWLQKFKELKHLVEHHLEEEEQEVFQVAGKELTDNQKEVLAEKYDNDMERRRSA